MSTAAPRGGQTAHLTLASERLDGLMQGRSIEFLRGEPYGSPPVYAPGLKENYRPVW